MQEQSKKPNPVIRSRFDEPSKQGSLNPLYLVLGIGFVGIPLVVLILVFLMAKGYSFTVSPEKAAQNPSMTVTSGFGVFTGSSLYTLGGPVRVTVDAPFYQPKMVQLDGASSSNVSVTLEPTPFTVEATVSEPSSSLEWYFDGALVYTGESLKHVTEVGTHQVKVVSPYYEPVSRTVDVGQSEVTTLHLDLVPLQGNLTITTSPAGAALKLNGIDSGQTDYAAKMKAGEYTLDIAKEGFEPVTDKVSIKDKQLNVTKSYRLKPVRSASAPKPVEPPKAPAPPKQNPAISAPAEAGEPVPKERQPVAQTLGLSFVRVSMTPFTMGSPANERGRMSDEFEKQVEFTRKVLVGRHEVTNKQFSAFDSSKPADNNPVTQVSWNEAALYANWLSEQDGLPVFYKTSGKSVVGFNPTSKGYRLLTEAEWEWLAKASARSVPTQYVWGNQQSIPAGYGNYGAVAGYTDKHSAVAPVGQYPAERLGIFDLSGNVSEWVHDVHNFDNPSGVSVNPMGPQSGASHVYKGGNFKSAKLADLGAARRPSAREGSDVIGFRLARFE